MGYVSLKTSLQTDQVLAIANEYTYGGRTYQVGEFASDVTDASKALFVKSLKNTSNNPSQGNWPLMMKNVYYLASTIEKDKFRLDVKYQSDTTGVYLSYIPEPQVKSQTLIKVLGADRLDNNNKAHSNGYFDYVEGYTYQFIAIHSWVAIIIFIIHSKKFIHLKKHYEERRTAYSAGGQRVGFT